MTVCVCPVNVSQFGAGSASIKVRRPLTLISAPVKLFRGWSFFLLGQVFFSIGDPFLALGESVSAKIWCGVT